MAGKINLYYDKESDILDVAIGKPRKALSKEIGHDILVRILPRSKEIVGLTVLNFEKRFSKISVQQQIPISAKLQIA